MEHLRAEGAEVGVSVLRLADNGLPLAGGRELRRHIRQRTVARILRSTLRFLLAAARAVVQTQRSARRPRPSHAPLAGMKARDVISRCGTAIGLHLLRLCIEQRALRVGAGGSGSVDERAL